MKSVYPFMFSFVSSSRFALVTRSVFFALLATSVACDDGLTVDEDGAPVEESDPVDGNVDGSTPDGVVDNTQGGGKKPGSGIDVVDPDFGSPGDDKPSEDDDVRADLAPLLPDGVDLGEVELVQGDYNRSLQLGSAIVFRVKDHPDGEIAPPPYALRFDGLFAGRGGATGGKATFSAETNGAELYCFVDPVGGFIRFAGTVYGGEDTGTGYGYGAGLYRVDMTYNYAFGIVGNGFVATDDGANGNENHGRLIGLTSPQTQGARFEMYDFGMGAESFLLLQDGHRLNPGEEDTWVGRGWLTKKADHTAISGTHDWLFVAEKVETSCPAGGFLYKATEHFQGHALWFPNFNGNGKTVMLRFRDDARFELSTTYSGKITGTAYIYDLGGGAGTLGEEWQVELNLAFKGQGAPFGGPKIEQPSLQPSWITDEWEYFDLTSGTMTKPGSLVVLDQMPADGSYPYQFGDAANGKNKILGASMWFFFDRYEDGGATWDGYGDINVELMPLPPPGDCCPAPSTYTLGDAKGFNVFACGDYAGAEDILGKLAVKGNVDFLGFSVGQNAGGGDVMLVGGDTKLRSGTIWGNLQYGGALDIDETVDLEGGATSTPVTALDFAATCDGLVAASAGLAALPVNGLTQITPWGAIKMTGTHPDLNIFEFNSAQMGSAVSIELHAPASSTVLINVTGASVTFKNFQMNYSGIDRSRVIYNAHQALDVEVTSIQFEGSLLAPKAHVHFHAANIMGSLFAKSVEGNGEAHNFPFDGELEFAPICPDPGPATNACLASFHVVNTWEGGYQATLLIEYAGAPASSWNIGFELPAGDTIVNGWYANFGFAGQNVTAESLDWNGLIESGSTIAIGYIGAGAGDMPSEFSLNGTACTLK